MPKTLEEMTAEMHAAMFDPRRKLATSEEVGKIREDVMLVDSAAKTRTEAHEQKDEQRHKDVLDMWRGTNRDVAEIGVRVAKIEEKASRKPSPYPGSIAPVSFPPPGAKRTDTGSWTTPPGYLEDLAEKIAHIEEAREQADERSRVAEAKEQGAKDALAVLAAKQAAEDAARRQAHADDLATAAASRGRIAIWLTVASLALAALTGVVFHLLHL